MGRLLISLVFLLYSQLVFGSSTPLFRSFRNPSAQYRPKFRYWLPDASIPPEVLTKDIASIASVGAGGLEFLPFYLYGDVIRGASPPTDWTTFGFGTPAFRNIFQTALEAAKKEDLVFDFVVGANQGQGVPSIPGTPGLAVELRCGHTSIPGGTKFDGAIPAAVDFWSEPLSGFIAELEPFGDDTLVAIIAGQIISLAQVGITVNGGAHSGFPVLQTTLNESSIIDLTSQVSNGHLNWTAPDIGSNYTLIAFYERYTNQRSCIGGVNATNPIANGSWLVDHFSASGSQRTTDFLDEYLIYDEVKTLLQEVGEYSWEDSMEQQSALFWTPNFLQKFESARGYSAVKYLPLFFNVSNQWGQEIPAYNETWVYGEYNHNGESVHLDDYRTTLNEGYQEYLKHFKDWANALGLNHSCQPAYNLPLDMLADVPVVDVPELESLAFNDDIDLYRQFVGPAHLQQKNIISTEVGAVSTGAYSQTVPSLLRLFKDSFAAGVNMMVIHGFAYTGEYPETTWPGYTAFFYRYTEQWNDKQPAWRHLKDTMDYTARCQLILQTGVPRVDLALYLFEDPWTARDVYVAENLKTYEYTYEYLTAANLLSTQAYVDSGILAPSGPAYKALIFYNQTQISEPAVQKLHEFASAGLPILFVGGLPTNAIGTNGTSSSISEAFTSLVATYPQVQVLSDSDALLAHLQTLDMKPRAFLTDSSQEIYTQWRSYISDSLEAVLIFNKGLDKTISFEFTGVNNSVPYVLDAWTGKRTPLVTYNVTEAGISTSLDLKANQTTILAFQKSSRRPTHVVSSKQISAFSTNNNTGIDAIAAESGVVTLSDGRVISVAATPFPSMTIGNWSLQVLSYHPSSNTSSTKNEVTTLDIGNLDALKPWTEIPGLQQVSGVGIYNSSFIFSWSPSGIAAYIDFGPVLNTIRVWVNNKRLPPIDISDPRTEISSHLGQGLNTICVEVSSTLFNAVKARSNETTTAYVSVELTNAAFYEDNDYMPFGLLGPVVLTPMTRVALSV